MKQIIGSGHVRVFNLGLLKFIDNDSPQTKPMEGRNLAAAEDLTHRDKTGDTYALCYFAKFECHKSCYASESMSCSVYRLLMKSESYTQGGQNANT